MLSFVYKESLVTSLVLIDFLLEASNILVFEFDVILFCLTETQGLLGKLFSDSGKKLTGGVKFHLDFADLNSCFIS